MNLDNLHWYLAFLISVLVGLNTLFWGYVVKEVGSPALSPGFFYALFFNKWFILAMVTGFTVAVLSYWVFSKMGVMLGRFFLSLSLLSIIIVGYFVLRESVSYEQWLGVVFVIIGILLIGRM